MIILAQENFSGVFGFILFVFAVLIGLALLSFVFSSRAKWYGPVMTIPGMLISVITTGGFFSAATSTQDVHFSALPFFLFPAPLVLGIISFVVWSVQKSAQRLK